MNMINKRKQLRKVGFHLVSILLLLLTGVVTAVSAGDRETLILDHQLISKASTRFNVEVIDADGATDGKATRFLASEKSRGGDWVSMHGMQNLISWRPGLYRVSVRLRPAGGGFRTNLQLMGSNYETKIPFQFKHRGDEQGFITRQAEVHLLSDLRIVRFANGKAGMIVDEISVTPVKEGPSIELAGVKSEKLAYDPGEPASATISAINYTNEELTRSLRVTVKSNLDSSRVVYHQNVTIPPGQEVHEETVPLDKLPEWGHTLEAAFVEDEEVLSVARDWFFVTDQPLKAGQYGVLNMHPKYKATNVTGNIEAMRNNFQTVTEMSFWAPCDMSMLVPPPGHDRWLSGQSAVPMSTEKVNNYVDSVHRIGADINAYVDYSIVFGYRIYDLGRRFPRMLHWDTQNADGFIWMGLTAGNLGLDSPLRPGNETGDNPSSHGKARTLHTSSKAIRWHGEQMVKSMNTFGFDGFRYDDPPHYGVPQVDILGRRAPFHNRDVGNLIAYWRKRLEEENPDALYGHNLDTMEAHSNPWYYSDQTERQDKIETAILRDGGFALQEAWSNRLMDRSGATWSQWRKRTVRAGRKANRSGGEVGIITGLRKGSWWKRKLATAVMLASGTHIAYDKSAPRPLLAKACRYSELFYSDDLHWLSREKARRTVDVSAEQETIWWKDWVRVFSEEKGRRVYLIHTMNPPEENNISKSKRPAPLTDLTMELDLPDGWTPTDARLLSAEREKQFLETLNVTSSDGERMVNRKASHQYYPSSHSLKLNGSTISVPDIRTWGLVAVTCEGPGEDEMPSDVNTKYPAPKPADLSKPDRGPTADGAELVRFHPGWLSKNEGVQQQNDENAHGGKAVTASKPFTLNVKESYGSNFGWEVPIAMGRYRVTVRARATESLQGTVSMTVKNGPPAPEKNNHPSDLPPVEETAQFDLSKVKQSKYVDLNVDMEWGEMSKVANLTFEQVPEELLIESIRVRCLKIYDSKREKLWGKGWPEEQDLVREKGTRIWFGKGIYADYWRFPRVFKGLQEPVEVSKGHHMRIAHSPRGVTGNSIPKTKKLARHDLLVTSNIDTRSFNYHQLHRLHGWVKSGGTLVMTGGPFGFGRGEWHLSDMLSDMIPARMKGKWDLRPVGDSKVVELQPASDTARRVDWSDPPVLQWMHVMEPEDGASVHATADGKPVIISGEYGGRNSRSRPPPTACFLRAVAVK